MKSRVILCLLFLVLFANCRKEVTEGVNVEDTLYISSEGSKMPVYLYGNMTNNTIIVLLHGGPGGSGLEYRDGKYAADLEKEFVVAYWDQRGQGMSQGHQKEAISVAQMVEDLRKLILTIKHKYGADKSIFLYGHSWGGLLGSAFMVTKDNQELVKGWIESNGAHDLPRLNKSSVALFKQVANEQLTLGNSKDYWTDILTWANAIDTNNIDDKVSGEINQKGFEAEDVLGKDGVLTAGEDGPSLGNRKLDNLRSTITGNATNSALNEEIEQTALTNQLFKINKPCLFLFSRYDFVVPPQLGIDAYNAVSTADKNLIIYQTSGHSPMSNQPNAYVKDIVSFVNAYR